MRADGSDDECHEPGDYGRSNVLLGVRHRTGLGGNIGCKEKYLQLFESLENGVAFHEMVYDAVHHPIDYVVREANDAYTALLGIPHADLINHRANTIYGYGCLGDALHYAHVLTDNTRKRFETYSPLAKKHLSVSAIPIDEGIFATVLVDITKWKDTKSQLKQSLNEVRRSLRGAVNALSATTAWRDPYTSNHQHRVAKLAYAIGEEMQLPKHDLEGLYIAGLLHDIGKIAVPIDILCKPGKITDHEFGIIKDHPKVGYDILHGVHFPWPVADVVLQHHARLDGSGYPAGLKDDGISLPARIISVADVVEAMSSHRPYRPALGLRCALNEITQHAGTQFDPVVVKACCRICENSQIMQFS
ncbi:MAG TPA: HD-GYP domain-containing protein [Armatimonadota bacterium]|nr:HD-GYP domain-containing protein [Armatimonadota bacterium]